MCGGVSDGDLQHSLLVSEECVDDVFEAGAREGIGVPALDHQVVQDEGATRGRGEAVSTVHLFNHLENKVSMSKFGIVSS